MKFLENYLFLRAHLACKTIFNFAEIEEEFGYYFLYEMEEKHILNKRISDVEYVFVFNTNELRKTFLDTLSKTEFVEISVKAAEMFEQKFIEHGEVNESLIDYFIASENVEQAAIYCVKFANLYLEKSNSHKAIDLIDMGLELYLKLNMHLKVIELGMKLIKLLIKAGRLDKAMERVNFLYGFIEDVSDASRIDVQLEHAYILYFKNDIARSEELSQDALTLSSEIGYLEGELRAAFVKCKCTISKGDLEGHRILAMHYLAVSKLNNLPHHIAVFENEKGINHLYNNQFDASIDAFTESLKYYKESNDEENIVRAYHNFGVIYLDGYWGLYSSERLL